MGAPVGRPLPYAHQAPPGLDTKTLGKGSDGRSGRRSRHVRSRGKVERDQGQERRRGVGVGAYEVVDCGGDDTDGILGRITLRGGDLTGSGPDLKRGR